MAGRDPLPLFVPFNLIFPVYNRKVAKSYFIFEMTR